MKPSQQWSFAMHDEIMYLIKVKLNMATDYFNLRQILDHFSVHVKGRLGILKTNLFHQISLSNNNL